MHIYSYKRGIAALGVPASQRSVWRRPARKQPPVNPYAQSYVHPYAQHPNPYAQHDARSLHEARPLPDARSLPVAGPVNARVELDLPRVIPCACMEESAHSGDPAHNALAAVYSMHGLSLAGTPMTELVAIEELALPGNFVCPDTFVLRMHSNDMAPAMPVGAYLGVSRADTRPLPGVFVLKGDHPGLLVRRIFMDYYTKSFILRPDNDKSPESRASAEEVVERIVGRVIWVINEII